MGYKKKNFDGKYLEWYTIISNNLKDAPEINEYLPVKSKINNLDWQGENKESIIESIDSIDKICQNLYQDILNNIKKVQICTNTLYNDLTLLKNKYEEYNSSVDEYNRKLEIEKRKKAGENS